MGKIYVSAYSNDLTKISLKKLCLIINIHLLICGAGKIRAARTGPWRTEKSSWASPLICKTHGPWTYNVENIHPYQNRESGGKKVSRKTWYEMQVRNLARCCLSTQLSVIFLNQNVLEVLNDTDYSTKGGLPLKHTCLGPRERDTSTFSYQWLPVFGRNKTKLTAD